MMPSYWVHITAGQGPDECTLAVKYTLDRMIQEAQPCHLKATLLETTSGKQQGTYQSVLLSLQGHDAPSLIHRWQGTVQWIANSPYRPGHKRKNWFIGVDTLLPYQEHTVLNEKDVTFETMRASGPGGQHVNTTNSAVRVRHLPTGFTTTAQEERSQHRNKQLALARLAARLQARHDQKQAAQTHQQWQQHRQLERGHPIRTFVGPTFREKT